MEVINTLLPYTVRLGDSWDSDWEPKWILEEVFIWLEDHKQLPGKDFILGDWEIHMRDPHLATMLGLKYGAGNDYTNRR